MKKTKIVCTMGPNSDNENVMRALVKGGMDIARFNFSHGTHEEQKERMNKLKRIREEEGKHIAILLDTKGPEIRTSVLKDGKKVQLVEGSDFVLTTEEIVGDENRVSITYKGLVEDVAIGGKILIEYGEPIYPEQLEKEQQKHLGEYVRNIVADMYEKNMPKVK